MSKMSYGASECSTEFSTSRLLVFRYNKKSDRIASLVLGRIRLVVDIDMATIDLTRALAQLEVIRIAVDLEHGVQVTSSCRQACL